MALPATVYQARIELSDIDRSLYEPLQVTVARHPSETAERLVARLLAYALFFETDLTFTRGIGAGDEPDLWIKGPDGRVLLWIEVGLPDPERLVKASRHTERLALLAVGSSLSRWHDQHGAKLAGIPNLTFLGIDHQFISQLVDRLQRSITWALTITEGTLFLTADGETLTTDIIRFSPTTA